MTESNYNSVPILESNNMDRDHNNDVITLNILTMYNNDSSSLRNTSLANQQQQQQHRPTTPTPSRRLLARKPKNLHLNINPHAVETANDILSNDKLDTAINNSTSSTTPSTSTTTTTSTTTFPHEQKMLNKKLNIGFENIRYTAKMGYFKRETKEILHGLTGHFRSGELSAIVGPSGAGKSTILNIISGYTSFGYTGDVTVNDHRRDLKVFKSNVAFIRQDTSLQSHLTVKEAMHFSANLKIGSHMSKSARRERVKTILEAIGMYENRHTRTGKLSGGQKKRLSIALELVNNPPVLILDEPTSGLDSSTSNQCISLLKKLALEGRSVICTIHQPSALAFEMFDHLYAIARGSCIYSGGTQNLVPFLAEIGLECPETYNPADYLMEIATDEYGPQNEKLIEKIENGRNNNYRQTKAARKIQLEAVKKLDKMMASGLMTPVTAPVLSPMINISQSNGQYSQCYRANSKTKPLTPIKEMSSRLGDSRGILNEINDKTSTDDGCCQQMDSPKLCKSENIYATPFHRQLSILLLRTFLILWRDKSLTCMRFTVHIITALMIGFIYYGIGNEAENVLNSFRYCFYSIMFIMYSAFSAILVKFPLEFPIVSREHFNRWYSLRAYYVAITLADIPIQLLCTSTYILITYLLTDQPREIFRMALFCFVIFLTALVGQSIGLTVGASLSIKLAAIFGPFFISPFLAFSGFFVQEKHAPEPFKWIFKTSFIKYSFDASVLSLFGYDRPRLECHTMYCHYSRPKLFLKDVDMENANYEISIIFLVCVFVVLRIISFYIMSFRLRLFR